MKSVGAKDDFGHFWSLEQPHQWLHLTGKVFCSDLWFR